MNSEHISPALSSSISRLFGAVSRFLSVAIIVAACTVLAGWIFNIAPLKSVLPNYVTMKVNTAICFGLAGLALWTLTNKRLKAETAQLILNSCAVIIFITGMATLCEYLFQWDLGIDQLVFRDDPAAVMTSQPGRMALNTAVNFVIIAIAFMLVQSRRKSFFLLAQSMALVAGLVALFAFTGYAYRANPLIVGIHFSTAMAVHTTVLFLAVCTSFLFARPQLGIMSVITSDKAGGRIARVMLPVAIILPVLMGWFRILAVALNLLSPEMSEALEGIVDIVVISVFIYIFAAFVNRSDEQLQESEERYRAISEYSGNAICIVDEQAKITWANSEMLRMGGYSREQVCGAPSFVGFIAPESIEFVSSNFYKFLSGAPYEHHYTFYFIRSDGEKRFCEKNMTDFMDRHGRRNLIISMTDVTERKRMEEELIRKDKLESLGVLAGGIAHDFNNILTGIMGNISMVRYGMDKNDKAVEILNEAEKAASQAKNLTQQLLTFARGGMPVKKVTAIPDLLRESAVFATRGSKATCEFSFASNLMPVEADPGQIAQVVSNIVINAVQAMPDGGLISIVAENVAVPEDPQVTLKPGPYIRVVIRDRGAGIPSDLFEKIFDPFFTTKPAGNGLGLATSYSIIKKHDGCITVESDPGKGSSFAIYLPGCDGHTDSQALRNAAEIKNGYGRILLMDDNPMICRSLSRIMVALGYTVESVYDSDQAVSRYRETWGTGDAFDAVILDLTVPGGRGGKDAISLLKAINPGVKAVVSSGYSADRIMVDYKEYGFSAILPKPFNVEDVSEILDNLFHRNS